MEVDTLVQSPPSPWLRTRSDIQNPFQNAPGPFIYALPNLACFCPSMSSDSIADYSLANRSSPDQHHHHTRHRCCYQPPRSEFFAESQLPAEERADADVTLRAPRSRLDENGPGDNNEDATITFSYSLTESEAEIRGNERQRQKRQPRSESSTPTLSSRTPLSATESESSEELYSSKKQDRENERGGEGKEKVTRDSPAPARVRGRGKRREHRQRTAFDLGGRAIGPRTLTRLAPDPWMYQYQYPAPYPTQYPYHGMVPYASLTWYWQPPPAPVSGFVNFR